MESMDTFRKKVQKSQVNYTSPLYARKIIRKFSPYITRFLVTNTKISANQVTILQLVSSLIGLGFLCFADIHFALVGVCLLHLGYIFDCVDGEVARYRKTQSINGMFLDFVNHEIIIPMTYACLAFHYFFKDSSILFFLIAITIIIAKNNPIGRARQTTINYLIDKRKSPTYDIRQYSTSYESGSLHGRIKDTAANDENNLDQKKATIQSSLQKFRTAVTKILNYPNDIIIVSVILIIELLSGNEYFGKLFLLTLAFYLTINFIFDLWWHMKKRVVERDFVHNITSCAEIHSKIIDTYME